MRPIIKTTLAATSATMILIACGGGDDPPAAVTPTTTISGSVVKGPVSKALVIVKDTSGKELGRQRTETNGTYSLDIPFKGDVLIEVTEGTYTDEATGAPNTPLSAPLKLVLNANGGKMTGMVTPLTTMAYTYASANGATPTSSDFNARATMLANQFQLGNIDLTTTKPLVAGEGKNPYGKVLAALSRYLEKNKSVTLDTLVNTKLNKEQSGTFSVAFTTAYNTDNPSNTINYAFDGSTLTISGTGQGGGNGTCGVAVSGNVTTAGFSAPFSGNYCITGIAAGSCTSGNNSVSSALSGQLGAAGVTNVTSTVSPTCAAGAIAINLTN